VKGDLAMSQENADSLPSLACPILVNPAPGVDDEKEKFFELPFPDIDLNWDGFTIPHLHLVGINETIDGWRYELALLHELCHRKLALTPHAQLIKYQLFVLYDIILRTFPKGEEQIDVPVTPDLSGNEFQKELKLLGIIRSRSMIVEEVVAVRSSLLTALQKGLIEPDTLRPLIRKYKRGYEKFIPGFAAVFNQLNFVAGKIGETATRGLIDSVFDTFDPNEAFIEYCVNKRTALPYGT
jgi:hypothetical protein